MSKQIDETIQLYYKEARIYALTHGENVSPYIEHIIALTALTRDKIVDGSEFTRAVVKNDLYCAINKADKECILNMKIIVNSCKYFKINKK